MTLSRCQSAGPLEALHHSHGRSRSWRSPCAAYAWPVAPRCRERLCAARNNCRDANACLAFFEAVDRRIDVEGVRDAQDARIENFPYLRVNRLLAALETQGQNDRLEAWIERLASLDRAARRFELANLPDSARSELQASTEFTEATSLEEIVETCRRRLIEGDLSSPERLRLLSERAIVPSEYSRWKRMLGLYAITFAPVLSRHRAFGVAAAGDIRRTGFTERGSAHELWPAEPKRLTPPAVREIMQRSAPNLLGLREPSGADRAQLIAAFAPEFVVDETGSHDRIGALHWREPGTLAVDVDEPVVYAPSRIRSSVVARCCNSLRHLVFRAPRRERFDLLSGHLDGVIWRVTLTPDGEPWIFDSIHACGCYHQFFTTTRAQRRPAPRPIEEWAFTPQRLPRLSAGERVRVHLATRTHYIQKIETAGHASSNRTYRLVDADVLRSLPHRARSAQRLRARRHHAGNRAGGAILLLADGHQEPRRDAAMGETRYRIRR